MSQVVIENPIINSPFDEPTCHFRFTDEGITDEIVDGRRSSAYFVPIARPKKKGSKQLQFDTEWTQDRIEENKLVNDIRRRVALWRKGGYVGTTTPSNCERESPQARSRSRFSPMDSQARSPKLPTRWCGVSVAS